MADLDLIIMMVFGGILTIYLTIELGLKFLLPRLNITPYTEFPEIGRTTLLKFSSFDADLGWEPQPNSKKKKDTGHSSPDNEDVDEVTYSTDKYGSRVCALDRDNGPFRVATYGDSYCFCRGVNDYETYQHYLAKTLDVHVSNYGAGNYGLDQAILRLKRRFEDDPADYVVMAVTASSIARILSVWKHYHEFGNTLAVKPRFEINEKGLTFIPSPVDKKVDLLNLEQKKEFLREHDYHYENWFKPRSPSWPYTKRFLHETNNIPLAFWSVLGYVEKKTNREMSVIDITRRRVEARQRFTKLRIEYHRNLFNKFGTLYCRLVGEFVDFVRKRGSVPIFVPLQQLQYVRYQDEYGRIEKQTIAQVESSFPDLIVVDPHNALHDSVSAVEDLYVERGEGGHHSPTANRVIANRLAEAILENYERDA